MFARNAWYVAAWADEVGEKVLPRRICDDPVVLFRQKGGKVAALEDRCCHRAAPLRCGEVVERGLQCGYHGLIFDGTGRCVHIPWQDRIPTRARVRSYPVIEKDALIWIWMGDPEKADAERIVDFPYHNDRTKWPHKHYAMHIKADYLLLVDNLMDLTHLAYVHSKTNGGDPAGQAKAKVEVTPTDDGLILVRLMPDSLPPPLYIRAVGFKNRIDRRQELRYIAPATVVQWSTAVESGSPASDSSSEDGLSIRLFHGMTPETENTCFYFWSIAVGFRLRESSALEEFASDVRDIFAEDKDIVEAQQLGLDEKGESGLVNLSTDGARMHMRRAVERILTEERSVAPAAQPTPSNS
jgi:phenylpropionate dioxygenase-like ring-hydroxylating dioxygenase large terminal subunit